MTVRSGKITSLRLAKRECKKSIRAYGLKIVKTIKRLYLVQPKPNFLCMRWYAFTVAATNHPSLDAIIQEQQQWPNQTGKTW